MALFNTRYVMFRSVSQRFYRSGGSDPSMELVYRDNEGGCVPNKGLTGWHPRLSY